MSTIIRQEVSFVSQVDYKINNLLNSFKIKRDGVLLNSNKYNKIYFSVNNKLFITSLNLIESKFDGCDEVHDIESINPITFILNEEILQITLSYSELMLAICCPSNIYLCDARALSSNVKT